MMEIYQGRPANADERLPKEKAVYDLLDSLGITYERVDHEAVMTIEACREIDDTFGFDICKNLFLCNRQKTSFYLLLMPGEKQFVTKEVCRQIPSPRLSFADAECMEKYLNIAPGAVSVMGLMNDTEHQVKLLIDKDLLDSEDFGCHPCVNTSSIKMKTKDILEKFLPAVKHAYQVVEL